ncbi:FtsK/SpoIIIE domain-containing protein [Companilactobacillus sp.]|uniref:FtsK/SpoIIIE domain-containing protein n=1 Tax=Companilactobacillus sp. TaxID=2767905 RepID=UPI0025B7D38D|nr:FtsK/SpoIIIE domain-containing protein [Companilactobacillus sp.]MCH4009642.1 AAA family ATPase [Companilactobacillus sp.]MCH4052682.1 AAA family ATPase [Companilactobacillus sp.]MCH4077584.1 AAA family ATPase [Companilactobacillus sp.]MCH4126160.1 AAA family ATPase [Companilactobacillus sp.]MCI1311868.1 AAA family ATPase [Companilactobacillus sp.]
MVAIVLNTKISNLSFINYDPLMFNIVLSIMACIVLLFEIVPWIVRNKLCTDPKNSILHYSLIKRVRSACLNSGIYTLSSSDIANIPIIKLKISNDKSRATLKIRNSVDIEKKLENVNFSSVLGKYVVVNQGKTRDEDWYKYELEDRSVNPKMIFNSANSFKKFNQNYTEDEIFIDNSHAIKMQSALIVGQTGSGKTYSLYAFILQMIMRENEYDVFIADPKKSGLYVFGKKLNNQRVATSFEEIESMIKEFYGNMTERKKELGQKMENDLNSTYLDFGYPPSVLIIDEFALFKSILDTKKKDERDKIQSMLNQIIWQGRQLGVFIWIAMQKSGSDSIPTSLRENLPFKLVLGNAEPQTYVTAFGTGVKVPNQFLNLGEGLFICPGVANTPQICSIPTLNFNPLDGIGSAGNVITGAPPEK